MSRRKASEKAKNQTEESPGDKVAGDVAPEDQLNQEKGGNVAEDVAAGVPWEVGAGVPAESTPSKP